MSSDCILMTSDRLSEQLAFVASGMAVIGGLGIAGYVLFTDVTTLGQSSEPATAIEAGNVPLIILGLLPAALATGSVVGGYFDSWQLPLISGVTLLLLGFVGLNVGILFIPIGVLLVISAVLFRSSSSPE